MGNNKRSVESKSMQSPDVSVIDNGDYGLGLGDIGLTLRTGIKTYLKKANQIEGMLDEYPDKWGKFQSVFNYELDSIFRNIMVFEKINLSKGDVGKVEKLNSFFIRKLRAIFERGDLIKWGLKRPFGYVGDFKFLEDIYENNPTTKGFDRLFDNYVQMSSMAVAVRNRKNDFKRIIFDYVNRRSGGLRILNLGAGSCRELWEILTSHDLRNRDFVVDCIDQDINALNFSREKMEGFKNINYIQDDVYKIAATKKIDERIGNKYDLIYSTGLFDYLTAKVAYRIVENLRKLLKSNGALYISEVRDKYSNPSVHFMELVGDWKLVYKNDELFEDIFYKAGFEESETKIMYEQQGVMHYMAAGDFDS